MEKKFASFQVGKLIVAELLLPNQVNYILARM